MAKRRPSRDPIAEHRRRVTAVRRVGDGARCRCGETRPDALIVTCAACQRARLGKLRVDQHHPAGKANSPVTVPIDVNDHRAVLNAEQQDWPPDTLKNPHGDPLLKAAACLRGYISTVTFLIERMLSWIVAMLELLSPLLVQKLGPRWWQLTDLPSVVPPQ